MLESSGSSSRNMTQKRETSSSGNLLLFKKHLKLTFTNVNSSFSTYLSALLSRHLGWTNTVSSGLEEEEEELILPLGKMLDRQLESLGCDIQYDAYQAQNKELHGMVRKSYSTM